MRLPAVLAAQAAVRATGPLPGSPARIPQGRPPSARTGRVEDLVGREGTPVGVRRVVEVQPVPQEGGLRGESVRVPRPNVRCALRDREADRQGLAGRVRPRGVREPACFPQARSPQGAPAVLPRGGPAAAGADEGTGRRCPRSGLGGVVEHKDTLFRLVEVQPVSGQGRPRWTDRMAMPQMLEPVRGREDRREDEHLLIRPGSALHPSPSNSDCLE